MCPLEYWNLAATGWSFTNWEELIWQPLVACDVLVDSDVGLLVQLVLLVGETISSTTNNSSIHYTTLAQLNY